VELELILDGKTYQVATNKTKDGYKFKVDDSEVDFAQIDFSGNCFKLNVNGKAKTVYVATDSGKSYVHIDGTVIPIETTVEESESGAAGNEEIVDGKQMVHSPMPGKVVKIAVEEGQQVKEKEILCVVEAMKMEHELRAKIAGVVKEISFKAGDLVGTEETILIVEPLE